MSAEKHLLSQAGLLASRLERLSADSAWAHRASGLRGSLLRAIKAAGSDAQKSVPLPDSNQLEQLIDQGFFILEQAASEIPTNEKP